MKQSLNTWESRYKSLAFWWCVGFGSGLLKPAPGTWGSLVGLGFGYGIASMFGAIGLIAAAAGVTVISVYAIGHIENQTNIHDAPEIVIDEFAGQWIAMVPLAFLPFSWPELAYSFVLFRIFDIIKPWPIGLLDRHVSGGFGVMVDDLVAGIFAAGVLALLMIYVI